MYKNRRYSEDYAAQIQAQQEFFCTQQELRDSQYQNRTGCIGYCKVKSVNYWTQYNDARLYLLKICARQCKTTNCNHSVQCRSGKTRTDNFKSAMGTIASLSDREPALAAIGKTAAVTNATIDGYAAVQKAMTSPLLSISRLLRWLVLPQLPTLQKIAGVGLAGGIDSVPKSAGGGNSGDNFPAILKPGERVVPSANRDLKAILANQDSGANVNINVHSYAGTLD